MQAISLLIMVLVIYGAVDAFLKYRKKQQQHTLKETRLIGDEEEIREIDVSLADLTSSDWRKRAAAVRQLGTAPALEALPELASRLDDPDSDVREAVVEALSKYGTVATAVVLPFLERNQADTRTAAANTLGLLQDKSALDALHNALSDVSSWVRIAVVDALGKIGAAESVDPLAETLNDNEASVREAAANVLIQIDTKDAKDALKRYHERTNHVSRRR